MSVVLVTALLPWSSLNQARVEPLLLPVASRVTVAGPQLETGVVVSASLFLLTVAVTEVTPERQPSELRARTK